MTLDSAPFVSFKMHKKLSQLLQRNHKVLNFIYEFCYTQSHKMRPILTSKHLLCVTTLTINHYCCDLSTAFYKYMILRHTLQKHTLSLYTSH